MIKKIYIEKIATFTTPVEILPKKINFIYGSNGSGKTTISKLIGGYINADNCGIENENSDESKILVYNKCFVRENFSQPVKGIFTLGQDSVEAQGELEKYRKENESKTKDVERKQKRLDDLSRDIESNKKSVIEKCWKFQTKIGNSVSGALVGYRQSKRIFFEKCISVLNTVENFPVEEFAVIKTKYDSVYSENSQVYPLFKMIDISQINEVEDCALLSKVIAGSNDTEIGKFIEFLGNSDWVKKGLEYTKISEKKCPFCTGTLSAELEKQIIDYFDEEYGNDCESIEIFIKEYKKHFDDVSTALVKIIQTTIPFINTEKLEADYNLFGKQLEINSEELKRKRDSPSIKITLNSLKELLEKININIKEYNTRIISNNKIVEDKEGEKLRLGKSLWEYIVSELRVDLESYNSIVDGMQRGITSIGREIKELEREVEENKSYIEEIENSLTSVAPTITEINNLLSKFDFKGFHLKENESEKGTYLILRENGADAKDTLSEGEYNFITFLYFYYLVYGSQEKTGITNNKVVVIDDPISSLDSNVLFIVSTLVKKLIDDCRKNNNGIKQTFILTHNVYFHKEVAFMGSKNNFSKEEFLFGIIRKKDNVSGFNTYEGNPIESTYQLMWRELKEINLSSITAFNTMRRILEYYFKIIGGMDYEKCISEFEGEDKMTCKALISCINDGSHFINEDFFIAFDDESIEKYHSIFELIFSKLGHEQHYNMMMEVNKK